jgi:hypothetical protein
MLCLDQRSGRVLQPRQPDSLHEMTKVVCVQNVHGCIRIASLFYPKTVGIRIQIQMYW